MCAGDMGVIVPGRQVAKSETEDLSGTYWDQVKKNGKAEFLFFLLLLFFFFFEFSFKDRNRGATGRKEISDGGRRKKPH